jgi:hypothetical protein
MDLGIETGTEARFRAYPADLALVRGHADRVRPFEDYCVGLLSAQSRKSVEPLAAVTAPERTAAHVCCSPPFMDLPAFIVQPSGQHLDAKSKILLDR